LGAGAMKIVLLGPPGAGKGTQAGILCRAFDMIHVSTGDMLREAIKEGTEVGKKAQGYMNKGELVPDEIVTRAVIDRINKPDAEKGVILDGFPRTRGQAESLDRMLEECGSSLDDVLYLKTSEETAVQRLSGRRVCPRCGKNYHVTNMPPVKEGVCDKCGVPLEQRDDDKPETVKNRLEVYDKTTSDLVDYYREKGLLRQVDGNISAEMLFEDIKKLFREEGLLDDDPDK